MTKANVLIAEDEKIVALDIKTSLESLGYKVIGQVSQGETAIQKASSLHPDIILMDIVLKGAVDGIQAAEQIHKSLNIPVVFLTAHSDESTLARARLAEPYGFIVKPFDYRELASNIEIAIYKHKAEQARRDHLKQLKLINEIGKAVSRLQDVPSVLEVIHEQVKLNLPLDVFFVCLYDQETDTVNYPLVFDTDTRYIEEPRSLAHETYTEQVIKSARPLLINRTSQEIHSYKLNKFMIGDKTRPSSSLMFAPLASRGNVIGVISAQSYKLNAYTDTHLDLLTGVACFASAAIENARLFNDVTKELTERKHIESILRESETKFRKVIENASDGIALIDSNGYVSEWNIAIENLTGFTHSQVIGHPIWDVIFDMLPLEKQTQEGKEFLSTEWKLAVQNKYGNKDRMANYEIETPEGVQRTIESNGFTIVSEHGVMGGMIMRDVTERQKTEQVLRENEERLRLITENAPSIIVELDTKGNIKFMSRVLPGYKIEDVIGKSVEDWIAPDSRSDMWKAFKSVLSTGTEQSYESYAAGANGEMRWYLSNLSPVLVNDLVKSIILITTDITELKNAETKLKVKNDELERFTYSVSHDLKAPLFSIRGFLGYLEKDMATGNEIRIKSDLDRINSSVEKMQQLLNNLLDLSRTGRLTNPYTSNKFEDLIRDAVEAVSGRIIAGNVTIEIAQNLQTVQCDRIRITQVLQNLIDNAVKFMGDQQNPQITIGQRDSETGPVFFVQDNGIGIAPENKDRVFGLFDKLNTTHEGTGIGLALAKRIIETHGGKIWVESDGLGKGSMFCFTIPDKNSQETSASV